VFLDIYDSSEMGYRLGVNMIWWLAVVAGFCVFCVVMQSLHTERRTMMRRALPMPDLAIEGVEKREDLDGLTVKQFHSANARARALGFRSVFDFLERKTLQPAVAAELARREEYSKRNRPTGMLGPRLRVLLLSATQLTFNLDWSYVAAFIVAPWLAQVIAGGNPTNTCETFVLVGAEVVISITEIAAYVAVYAMLKDRGAWGFHIVPAGKEGHDDPARIHFGKLFDDGLYFVNGFLWGAWLSFDAVEWGLQVWFGAGPGPLTPLGATWASVVSVAAVLNAVRFATAPLSPQSNGLVFSGEEPPAPQKRRWSPEARLREMWRYAFCFVASFVLGMFTTYGFVPAIGREIGTFGNDTAAYDCAWPYYTGARDGPTMGKALAVTLVTFTATVLAFMAFEAAVRPPVHPGESRVDSKDNAGAFMLSVHFPLSYKDDVFVPSVPHGFDVTHYPWIFTFAFAWSTYLNTDFNFAVRTQACPLVESLCPTCPKQHATSRFVGLIIASALLAVAYVLVIGLREYVYDTWRWRIVRWWRDRIEGARKGFDGFARVVGRWD
jgi:hypothetical protein